VERASAERSHVSLISCTGRVSTGVFQMFDAGKTWQFVPGIGSAPAAEGTATDPTRTAQASAFARERVRMVQGIGISAVRP
jgi:hypothetical protein